MNYLLNEGYESNIKVSKALKSKIYINKKPYEDLSYGAGTLLLGHNSKIYKKILNNLKKNEISNYATPNIYAEQLSKILYNYFDAYFKKFLFCSTGSEAVLKSLRIAKAVSKKDLIVSVSGSWHGSLDQFLFYPTKSLKVESMSSGISKFYSNNLKIIPYNDIYNSSKILQKLKSKIAAVIIEPIQGCLPSEESKKYLFFLQKFCDENKIILIFDETITGIRTYEGSVHRKFKLSPSISIFGKCIGGGAPISVLGISKGISQKVNKLKKKIYFGGTFSGNSTSAFICYETIKYIKNNKKIIKELNFKTNYIKNEINQFLEKKKLKAKIYSFESMLRIVFSNKKITNRLQRDFLEKKQNVNITKFKKFLFKNKIYYPSNGVLFISNETTQKNCKFLISKISKGLNSFFK